MVSLILILIISAGFFFIGYQALKHNRVYWFAPTIIAFKDRKEPSQQNCFSKILGFLMFLFGLFFLFLFLAGIYSVL
jgi:hypothetical protein